MLAGEAVEREREREKCVILYPGLLFERSLSANVIELLLCCFQSIRRTKHVRPQQPVPLFRCHVAIKVLTQVTYTPPCHLYPISMVTKTSPREIKRFVWFVFCFLIGNWTQDDAECWCRRSNGLNVSLIWSRTRCMVIEQVYTNSKQLLESNLNKRMMMMMPSDWLDSRMQLDSGLYNDPVSL